VDARFTLAGRSTGRGDYRRIERDTPVISEPATISSDKQPEAFKGADVMRLRNVLLLLAFLIANLLSGAASTLSAQTETGRITGLVLDQTGAVVPGATVTLTSTGSGAVRTTTSDAEGRF